MSAQPVIRRAKQLDDMPRPGPSDDGQALVWDDAENEYALARIGRVVNSSGQTLVDLNDLSAELTPGAFAGSIQLYGSAAPAADKVAWEVGVDVAGAASGVPFRDFFIAKRETAGTDRDVLYIHNVGASPSLADQACVEWFPPGELPSAGFTINSQVAAVDAPPVLELRPYGVADNETFQIRVQGVANPAFSIGCDGAMSWGAAGNPTDTTLERSGVGTLATGSLTVAGTLTIGTHGGSLFDATTALVIGGQNVVVQGHTLYVDQNIVVDSAAGGNKLYFGSGIDTTIEKKAAGVLGISGGIEFPEISDLAAGGANTGRLYARDNGSGKSQLCVRFPSGAIQVIATEP